MTVGVRILSRSGVASGFGLTGLPVTIVDNLDDAVSASRQCIADPSVGVVLVQQEFHDQFPDDLRHLLSRRPLPMVVPFPGPSREAVPEAADSFIVELLRQVIGYRVRLR